MKFPMISLVKLDETVLYLDILLLSLVHHAEWEECLGCTSLPPQRHGSNCQTEPAGTSYSTAVEALYILVLRGI